MSFLSMKVQDFMLRAARREVARRRGCSVDEVTTHDVEQANRAYWRWAVRRSATNFVIGLAGLLLFVLVCLIVP